MTKDKVFVASITRYCNYLERPNNWHKTPVATLSKLKLLELLMIHYENSGNFIYKIEVKLLGRASALRVLLPGKRAEMRCRFTAPI